MLKRIGQLLKPLVIPAVLLAGSLSPSPAVASPEAAAAPDGGQFCRAAIAVAEKSSQIPEDLLQAIAVTESGRWNKAADAVTPWPWTVMAEGRGRYFRNKSDAVREVEKLQARGIRNIDVGCMQVNLGFHGKAFASLEQAFDPIHNIAYAAAFLTHLRAREKSWSRAVRFYHSATFEKREPYGRKVIATWQDMRRAAVAGKRPAFSAMAAQSPALAGAITSTTEPAAEKETDPGVTRQVVPQWPPRSYSAQRRAEQRARSAGMARLGTEVSMNGGKHVQRIDQTPGSENRHLYRRICYAGHWRDPEKRGMRFCLPGYGAQRVFL